MKKALIVVDMQKDFVDGALGSPAAAAIVPVVAEKIREFDGDTILVTLDTHDTNYPQTLEGQKLPISPLHQGYTWTCAEPGCSNGAGWKNLYSCGKTHIWIF